MSMYKFKRRLYNSTMWPSQDSLSNTARFKGHSMFYNLNITCNKYTGCWQIAPSIFIHVSTHKTSCSFMISIWFVYRQHPVSMVATGSVLLIAHVCCVCGRSCHTYTSILDLATVYTCTQQISWLYAASYTGLPEMLQIWGHTSRKFIIKPIFIDIISLKKTRNKSNVRMPRGGGGFMGHGDPDFWPSHL